MTTTEMELPTTNREWLLIQHQAQELAKSDIIPNAYRKRPANVIVAALTGRTYGWGVLTAMRNGHVIDGTWGMKPEAMLGLVRARGHSVTGDPGPDGTTLHGKRVDNGDEMTVTFTLDNAVRAGLVKMKDGKPWARSNQGRALPWEQYPEVMCYWRAVGLLCRLLFPDVTAGVHSTEEMGAPITEEGDIIDAEELPELEPSAPAEPQPLSSEALEAFENACHTEGIDPDDVLTDAFGDNQPDPLTDANLPTMRDAFHRLIEKRAAESAEAFPESPPPTEEVRPATRGMVGKIKGEYDRLGIERDDQLVETASIVGHLIGSHNDLDADEAAAVLAALKERE